MTLIFALVPSTAPAIAPPPRKVGEAVELRTEAGTLHGTLDLPANAGPWLVVLVHPGSGPTDRDGNQAGMKNDSLKKLGAGLAERGIAVLRIDKRGVAASVATLQKEEDLRFEDYAQDTAAWLKQLRGDKRFSKIGIAGHSEGSLIAMLAAKKEKVDVFVSLCGAGRPVSDILREQLAKNLPEKLNIQSVRIIAELEAGRTVKDPPPELAALFRPSVQPYLISWFRHDPAKAVLEVNAPILIVDGTTDIQVLAADGDRLAKSLPAAKRVTLDKMNHVLREVPTTNQVLQVLTYQNPAVPLHPKLVPTVADFLRSAVVAP